MFPNREGRFKAYVSERGVSETGPNNLATLTAKFQLVDELVQGEWQPVQEDFDITGYFYLEKKDGSVNTITVDALKRALGWDGRDPFWLEDADLSEHLVQLKLGYETYNGQQKLKVQFIDAEDATPGGVRRADDATRKSVSTRLGSKLRALAGGTPVSTPKPQGRPASPPARANTATEEQAWAAFGQAAVDMPVEKQEQEWFRILGEMFPGKKPEQLTPVDWFRVKSEAPQQVIPF